MNSIGGIPVNPNRKIINKFNLNPDNYGLGDFSYKQPYTSCGGHYGDGTIQKCKSTVLNTSFNPSLTQGNMTNTYTNTKNRKKLNFKYFSADNTTHVGRRHEDGKNGQLIDSDSTGEVGRGPPIIYHQYRRDDTSQYRENDEKVRKYSYEGRKRSRRYGSERAKHGKVHSLVAFPCKNYIFAGGNGRRNVCDGCYLEKEELTSNILHKVLKIHSVEETGVDYPYEPFILLPKHIYCLNQQSRKRASDEGDPYYKTPPVDVSVETSLTDLKDQLKDEDLINELKRRKIEFPQIDANKIEIMESQDKQVAEVKPQQDSNSEPSDSADDRLLKLDRKTSLDDGVQNDNTFDKEDKSNPNKFVHEIKYYEGSFNIFGGEDKKESPFLKITKTVTFEKERGGRGVEKALGIDSWMQTDGDYDSEKDSNLSYGSSKNSNKGPSSLVPSLNDSFVETAKVCGECLKILASKYGGEKIMQGNFEPGKDTRLDKSTSVDKNGQNVMGMELIKNDLVRFIAELFLETIPKEVYNRMMGGNERMNTEEYEVRVKSYDRGSAESCNLKTCKMRNMDGKSETVKDILGSGGPSRNDCTCSDPMCNPNNDQQRKPSLNDNPDGRRSSSASKSTPEKPKKEEDNTYDCQITLNGKKILVKVNKSVEDLLLSGNIRNILRVSPNESFTTPNVRSKQTVLPVQEVKSRASGKGKVYGNCTCGEEMANDGRKESVGGKGSVSKGKGYGTQRSSNYDNVRRGDSFTAIETGNYQKKASSDFVQSGRSTKPLITSPPQYGSDGRKTDKSRNQDKNVMFDNTKSLFWSKVEVFNKGNEERDVSKSKKVKTSEYDPHNRIRNHIDYPYKVYPNRRTTCLQEKPKRHHTSGTTKQPDECFPLYWESQYLKYCDQIDGGCTEKTDTCKPIPKACNFVHEIEKRVMVAPSYGQCNAIDTPRPLCIIKIADNENCDNSQYRDYTVANVTSMKLNSNPFDPGNITCRKCIETLRSCSQPIDTNWSDNKQYASCGDVDLCKYYWNGITGKRSGESVYCQTTKDGRTTKSYTSLPSNEYCNVQPISTATPTEESDEKQPQTGTQTTQPKVSCRKLHGICFSVSRVPPQGTQDPVTDATLDDSKPKHVGVSTRDADSRNDREIQQVTKTSCTQTTGNYDKHGRDMGTNLQLRSDEKPDSQTNRTEEPELSCPSQEVKSNVNIEVLLKKEDMSPSGDSIEVDDGGKVEKKDSERKKLGFKRSWSWWWWWRRKKKSNMKASA